MEQQSKDKVVDQIDQAPKQEMHIGEEEAIFNRRGRPSLKEIQKRRKAL